MIYSFCVKNLNLLNSSREKILLKLATDNLLTINIDKYQFFKEFGILESIFWLKPDSITSTWTLHSSNKGKRKQHMTNPNIMRTISTRLELKE